MNNKQWNEFIAEMAQKKNVNLREVCKERGVGLNTLYRRVSHLQENDLQLYEKFIQMHPYKPRDVQGIDFEQVMRESILTNITQKELEKKYGVSKRTIQRKFAKIEEENIELYTIYRIYIEAQRSGKELKYSILEQVESEYIPQKIKTTIQNLEERRKQFLESMKNAKTKQVRKHIEDEIKRLDNQIQIEQKREEGREH